MRAPLFTLLLFVVPANVMAQATSQETALRFRIAIDPQAPEEGDAWRIGLQLQATATNGNSVGWSVEHASIRRRGETLPCDDLWTDATPVVDTPDGLWWVNHADPQQPAIGEFCQPPGISGNAQVESGSATASLDYFVEGSSGTPPPGAALLDYEFTLDGELEPEDSGADEPAESDDSDDDVPLAIPSYDINGDGLTDARDIQPFVDACLMECDYDIHRHAPCFVARLLNKACPDIEVDCNQNGIPDPGDIMQHTSDDCDGDGIPDECEIAGDPELDGDEDGTLDGCEPDCNDNAWPDDDDLATAASSDCDANGVPDECDPDCDENGVPDACDVDVGDPDGDEWIDPDCDQNGYPDACDDDCNENGVPDACDMDPSDPDGDNTVWPDCNQNAYPDSCDMEIPQPLGSTDCNANGIPDECDIAGCSGDPACGDCNENGLPDSCDIISEISQDLDLNGVPDECQSMQAQGGEMHQSSVAGIGLNGVSWEEAGDSAPSDNAAAWAEYYEWVLSSPWGPDSPLDGEEQFMLLVSKRIELGLPLNEGW